MFQTRDKRADQSSLLLGIACYLGLQSLAAGETTDWRHRVPESAFEKVGELEWVSSRVEPPFAFDELIYSWHIRQPGDTFRLYLQAGFGMNDDSDWLPAGFWGPLPEPPTKREQPRFDRGILDMDWLKLTTPATSFRFKVAANGTNGLAAPPSLTVIATRNASEATAADSTTVTGTPAGEARVLDVPLRRQLTSSGERVIDRCQSAALASAMEYFGRSIPMEDIIAHTYDPEYEYPGIWPRVIAAAQEFGFDAYIERFRDWAAVRQALAENKVILCSMRMKAGQCQSPPYRSMGNHIVALCGVTDDGRVVVTDSFLGKSGRGYLCQWLQSDFESVWMETKGGVAMVICPSVGAPVKEVTDLPPFPTNRDWPTNDDH